MTTHRKVQAIPTPSSSEDETHLSKLLERLNDRSAVVSVIGLGYVGLPLAVAFAKAGFRVLGLDIDGSKVEALNRFDSYIQDVPSETLRTLSTGSAGPDRDGVTPTGIAGSLRATADYTELGTADAVIVCVPTPLSKTKDPDMSHIVSTADQISRHLHRGMLIVLESTTYPGTTEELILSRLQDTPGRDLEVGRDFFLAFSPERLDPGRTDWTVTNTPKVIGGVTPNCLEAARSLYQIAVQQVVAVSSPKVAEMVKLLENTFRATNIALVNEFAIMCDHLGVDVWEVIEAAKTKPFGFMPFYPGPGLGGHCIPIDPQYLAWKLKTLNYNARFIQLAADINFGMPAYVLSKVSDALNEDGKSIKGSRILLLGVAYKQDVGDLRESPALDVINLLQEKGAHVSYHDPYVPFLDVDGLSMAGSELTAQTLSDAHCVVITTAHKDYDWKWVMTHSRLVVDTRNATRGIQAPGARVVKL